MPLQRRLPKFGFSSRVGRATAEIRTSELAAVEGDVVTIESLLAANIINSSIKRAKVMLSGDVARALTVDGLRVTKGARAAIEAAGGKVIDPVVPAHAGKKKTKKVVAQD
jgi:large subunit ribosomal protein L15